MSNKPTENNEVKHVTFTYRNGGYYCSESGEQNGVYVRAEDYEALQQRLRRIEDRIETQLCKRCNYYYSLYAPCKCGNISRIGTNEALQRQVDELTSHLTPTALATAEPIDESLPPRQYTEEYLRRTRIKGTFEYWLNREDYGDVEQLRRCWNAAVSADALRTDDACTACNGSGSQRADSSPDANEEACDACLGSGMQSVADEFTEFVAVNVRSEDEMRTWAEENGYVKRRESRRKPYAPSPPRKFYEILFESKITGYCDSEAAENVLYQDSLSTLREISKEEYLKAVNDGIDDEEVSND